MSNFVQRLKAARMEKYPSQIDFLALLEKESGLKLHRSQWSRIETGTQAVSIDWLPAICKAIDRSVDWLVLGIDKADENTFSFDASCVARLVDSLDSDLKIDVIRAANRASEIQQQRRTSEKEVFRLRMLLERNTKDDVEESGPDGYVYFIAAPEAEIVKIGFSTNPQGRIKYLATTSAYKLVLLCAIPGSTEYEKSLHNRFFHLRLNGEWFMDTPELRQFIDDLRDGSHDK